MEFAHLARFPRIAVTGPQRSGTTIAAKMIAQDTGHRLVDEFDFGVFDKERWLAALREPNVVVQCPHMLRELVDQGLSDVLVVLLRRDLAAIHASEERIGFEEHFSGNTIELATFGLITGDAARLKYEYWDSHPKPPLHVEIEFEDLSDHPLFIAAPFRAGFGPKQTELD